MNGYPLRTAKRAGEERDSVRAACSACGGARAGASIRGHGERGQIELPDGVVVSVRDQGIGIGRMYSYGSRTPEARIGAHPVRPAGCSRACQDAGHARRQDCLLDSVIVAVRHQGVGPVGRDHHLPHVEQGRAKRDGRDRLGGQVHPPQVARVVLAYQRKHRQGVLPAHGHKPVGGRVAAGIACRSRAEHRGVPARVERACVSGAVHVVRAPAAPALSVSKHTPSRTALSPAIPATPAASVPGSSPAPKPAWRPVKPRGHYIGSSTRCSRTCQTKRVSPSSSSQKREATSSTSVNIPTFRDKPPTSSTTASGGCGRSSCCIATIKRCPASTPSV